MTVALKLEIYFAFRTSRANSLEYYAIFPICKPSKLGIPHMSQ